MNTNFYRGTFSFSIKGRTPFIWYVLGFQPKHCQSCYIIFSRCKYDSAEQHLKLAPHQRHKINRQLFCSVLSNSHFPQTKFFSQRESTISQFYIDQTLLSKPRNFSKVRKNFVALLRSMVG